MITRRLPGFAKASAVPTSSATTVVENSTPLLRKLSCISLTTVSVRQTMIALVGHFCTSRTTAAFRKAEVRYVKALKPIPRLPRIRPITRSRNNLFISPAVKPSIRL